MVNFVELAVPFFILAMAVELAYGALRKNQTYRLNDALASLMMGSLSQLMGVLRLSFAAVVFATAVEFVGVIAWTPQHWWHWVLAPCRSQIGDPTFVWSYCMLLKMNAYWEFQRD